MPSKNSHSHAVPDTPGQRSGWGTDSLWGHLSQDAQAKSSTVPILDRPRFTVLVVDDNAGARYAMAKTLENAGYKTIQAAGGAEALLLTDLVSAVVLDVHLPDLHGLEVCRLMRRDRAPSFPIIHISAVFTEHADRVLATAAGADEYFVSPVDPALLVSTLDVLIARYTALPS